MSAYINGIGTISPQNTFGDVVFLEKLREFSNDRFTCIEPDYTGWIDARAIRRMSRIIRMGVASAGLALKEANLERPDAIITGTAFGCLEDTGIFLTKMIEYNEQALNPTPFIQSTHNTIGSQIALLLQCQGYNQTYAHRGFSFEHALLDGLMMVEQDHSNVLVGGVDEVTDYSFNIINRFELHKNGPLLNSLAANTGRHMQGEGASYFALSAYKTTSTYAKITGVTIFYKPETKEEIKGKIAEFLTDHNLRAADVDLILLGKSGGAQHDALYNSIATALFSSASIGIFKHLCGEYQTANAFALWLGATILKQRKVPQVVLETEKRAGAPLQILIYNQYFGNHHSLIALESC